MRVLLCVDGYGIAEMIERVYALLGLSSASLIGLHVTDVGPRHGLELVRRGFVDAERLGRRHDEDVASAERTRAESVLGELAGHLAGSGLRADLVSAEGVPEREIVRVSRERQVDVVVLFPRRFGRETETGPKSVGHTARFVVDHAPCAVLLLRGPGAP